METEQDGQEREKEDMNRCDDVSFQDDQKDALGKYYKNISRCDD